MFIYFILLNFYFRISIFLLFPHNIWHWRVAFQGLSNDVAAAAIFYLFFRILWLFIRPNVIRKGIFIGFIVLWIGVNFINHEYASEFNSLLPLSWFENEINNVGTVDATTEVLETLTTGNFFTNVVIPLAVSLLVLFKAGFFLKSKGLVRMLLVFLIGVIAQSNTLYPDFQPKRYTIAPSHLFKYWYYDREAQPLQKRRTAPLSEFSQFFKETIVNTTEEKNHSLPELNNKINIVLILMESFRAGDLGAYGSQLGLSPNFDRYAEKGVLFDSIYSTSNKTQRGVWSTICGAHTRKGQSVISDYPDHGVYCLTDVLAKNGYETAWFYGQSGSFDSLDYFIKSHNFKHIMDRISFPKEARIYGSGVGDEDIMKHALNHITGYSQPFFVLIQSTTNHHPRVAPKEFQTHTEYSDIMNKTYDTFAYSDYALGVFLDTFLATPLGKNSLVIVSADHGSGRSVEKLQSTLPDTFIKYKIPLLFLYPESAGVKPRRVNILGSQPDVMPTILDIIGIEAPFPVFGRSLLRDYKNRFAKGIIEGNWIITDDKVYYSSPEMKVLSKSGEELSPNELDHKWIQLIHEIDDVQDWMVQKKNPDEVYAGLNEKGWTHH